MGSKSTTSESWDQRESDNFWNLLTIVQGVPEKVFLSTCNSTVSDIEYNLRIFLDPNKAAPNIAS